jgi:methylamine dehydrogenase accessory protein MauD
VSGWWLVSYLALWAVVLATLVVLLVVLRQLGLIYLRMQSGGAPHLDEGPPVGEIVRPFGEIDEPTGREVRFPSSEAKLNLLLFASPGCDICKDALRGLGTAIRGRGVHALVVSEGEDEHERNAELRRLVDGSADFVVSLRRQRALGVESIPFGIATSSTGVVVDKRIVNSIVDLEDMLDRAFAALDGSPEAVRV